MGRKHLTGVRTASGLLPALVVAILLLVTAGSCNRNTGHNVSGPAAAVQTTSHHGTGTLKSLNVTVPSVEIEHGDIPGLMPAMTMEFHVQDKSLLRGLRAGDHIEFTIENSVKGMKITGIRKT